MGEIWMKKKLRLKKRYKNLLLLIILLTIIVFIPIGYKMYLENQLMKLKYSKGAISEILKQKELDTVKKIGYSETVDKAFSTGKFQKKYLESYLELTYVNHENYFENVHQLLDLGYSEIEVSLIVTHGSNSEVKKFLSHEKAEDIKAFLSIDFAKLENYDRYVNYQIEERTDEEETVLLVNIGFDRGYYENPNMVKTYSDTILVNKFNQLEEDFIPPDLVSVSEDYAVDDEQKLQKIAYDAFIKMANEAKKEDLHLLVNSSYRSFQDQVGTYQFYEELYGTNYVNRYVTKAGFSEHQTGLAIDVKARDVNVFANSNEFTWMKENAHLYGFVMRYPEDSEHITGCAYEAWHYRYLGVELATYLYENNMTYEEYYVRFLDK